MEEDALEALLLIETTAGGSGLARQLRHDLSRGWPVPGVTQEEEGTALLEHAEVLQGVPRLLATRRRFLLLGILLGVGWVVRSHRAQQGGDEGSSDWGVVSLVATSSAVRAGSRPWSARA